MSLSRYIDDITAFATATKAKAVYCYVVDGEHGTGGCPLVLDVDEQDRKLYEERCQRLIAMLRRSADLLEGDLNRQRFGR